MKPHLKKILVFIIGLLLLAPLKTIYLLGKSRYKNIVSAKAVYTSIEKSKKRKKNVKTLIIGDSVAQQLFSNYRYSDTLYSLACNQAISLAGQYVLINNFLSINPEVKNVVLIYTPFAFKKDLQQFYTFNYFLKPFYKEEYINIYSESVKEQIQQIPFYYTSQFPPVLTSNWSPDWYPHDSTRSFMSQLSAEYLTKIIGLCNSRSVKFSVLPTPTRVSSESTIEKFRNSLVYSNYNFKDYFSSIIYLPDSCFLDDVHLKSPERFKQQYLKMIDL